VPRGREPKNLPAVVLPHGGPYARDSWGFDELVQMLASRGYAVLQLNYRGSTGYGDAWFRAGFQHWGTTMHEDITAGTRWLLAQGIADPKRVCLVGWSFGGYAALIGGIKEPGLYRCIVSIAGVSDMKELAWENEAFYGGRWSTQLATGNEAGDNNSPLKRAAELKLPVMLVHGTWDTRVNIAQSRSMARALSRGGNPAKVVIIEKGDHSLSKPEMRLTLFQNLEQFLSLHLPAGN
jgi:dipeptidyl aminopeptidase/acylaminoacyl peptidase